MYLLINQVVLVLLHSAKIEVFIRLFPTLITKDTICSFKLFFHLNFLLIKDYYLCPHSHLFQATPVNLLFVKLQALIIIYNDFLYSVCPEYSTFCLDRMIRVGLKLIDALTEFILL